MRQWINVKSCEKISKSVSETLPWLKMTYSKHAIKKYFWLVWIVQKKVKRCAWGCKKWWVNNTDANINWLQILVHSDQRLGVWLIAENLKILFCILWVHKILAKKSITKIGHQLNLLDLDLLVINKRSTKQNLLSWGHSGN